MKHLTLFFLLLTQVLFSQSLFEKAEKLYKEKKFSEAKGLFESYLKSVPNHQKTIEYLGDIAGSSQKWDIAIDYYKKLKNQNPNSANYWFKYGGAMGMKAKSVNKFKAVGMIEDIETAFLKAASLDKNHVETRWALVMLYIELPGIVGGSEKKATKYADELLAISKVDGYLAKGYIDVYYKRYKAAEINLLKAHQIGKSATTYAKLFDLYMNKLKDKAKALNLKK
jgi:tetratricopeptide (TPR) repeat protein